MYLNYVSVLWFIFSSSCIMLLFFGTTFWMHVECYVRYFVIDIWVKHYYGFNCVFSYVSAIFHLSRCLQIPETLEFLEISVVSRSFKTLLEILEFYWNFLSPCGTFSDALISSVVFSLLSVWMLLCWVHFGRWFFFVVEIWVNRIIMIFQFLPNLDLQPIPQIFTRCKLGGFSVSV